MARRDMPKYSVLVPNYNHARYLKQRLDSIQNQTVTDWEMILMDDASSDNSREMLREFAARDERVQLVLNENNSGSPFKQWNKGVRLAKGEFVWIAESDDFADPHFLEKLGGVLDANPKVGIVYTQSNIVDSEGKSMGDNHPYTDGIDPVRWHHDFIGNGCEECAEYLILQNTIPNASAVLFRRAVYEKVGYAAENMRLSGDHHLWVKMLLESDIAYIAEPLNYYRQHGASVRSDTYRNGIYLEEAYIIRQLIFSAVTPRPERADFIRNDQVLRLLALTVGKKGEIPADRLIRIYKEGCKVDPILSRRLIAHLLRPQREKLRSLLRR